MNDLVDKLFETGDLSDDELKLLIENDSFNGRSLMPQISAAEKTTATRFISEVLSSSPTIAATTATIAESGATTKKPSATD